MLIVRGIMWISVLIVMLICMVKTKRNGMKKKIREQTLNLQLLMTTRSCLSRLTAAR